MDEIGLNEFTTYYRYCRDLSTVGTHSITKQVLSSFAQLYGRIIVVHHETDCSINENCSRAVIVNGIEDNYSPAGLEPARVHKRMGKYNNLVIPQRNYDDGGLDRNFFDYFELPVNITSGIFVIGLRPLGDNNNDLLFIGDTASNSDGQINQYYQLSTVEIQNNPAWVSQNGTHKIGLDELVIRQLSFGM